MVVEPWFFGVMNFAPIESNSIEEVLGII
jgi:hypothetical protein